MDKFINIDGNLINKDSIKSVTKICEDYPMVFTFSPHSWFEFYVHYDNKYLRFSESFRIKYFSNKPKSQYEKDEAYKKISRKREEILEKIRLSEK